jgi:DNA-binding response OmpR family regulator
MSRGQILIIEDDEDIMELLGNRLRSNGYQLSFASDGHTGLVKAKEMPDLIILDLMLPVVPGEVVCREIREDTNPQIAKTPIIMLTAKSSELDMRIGKVIGANTYLRKPFDADDLLAEIEKLLKE